MVSIYYRIAGNTVANPTFKNSWTIVYDTEYACQDKRDDSQAGVMSTALLFGDNVKGVLAGFSVAFIIMLTAAGILNGQSIFFYVISCFGAAVHLAWQLRTWNVNSPASCGERFKVSGRLLHNLPP